MKRYLVSYSLSFLFMLILGCQSPPQASLELAECSLDIAAKALAKRFDSETYERADTLLDMGRLEMARQKGRLPFLRNFFKADSLLRESAKLSANAARIAADSVATLRSLASTQVDSLENEVNRWREVLDGTLILFKAESKWSLAEMGLMTARQLLDSGQYEESVQQVTRTHSALVDLNKVFLEYADDEADNSEISRRWIENTLDHSRRRNDYAVIVDKAAHSAHLIKGGDIVKTYRCDLGYNSAMQKSFAGDGATPEGKYKIASVKMQSKYYKALLLDYPNDADKKRFRENLRKGLLSSRAAIGKLIEIHGHGGQNRDWTDGCVALSDDDLDDILNFVGEGTPVTIVRRWNSAHQN